MADEKDTSAAGEPEEKKPVESTYTREQVLQSAKYRQYRDIAGVVLEDGKPYTATEIQQKIDEFLKKPVKEKTNGKG